MKGPKLTHTEQHRLARFISDPAPAYLLPHERTWRNVWRGWRLREAVSAVLAFAAIMLLALLWAQCGQGGREGGAEALTRLGGQRGGNGGLHEGSVGRSAQRGEQ